jgi:hypothetical protein
LIVPCRSLIIPRRKQGFNYPPRWTAIDDFNFQDNTRPARCRDANFNRPSLEMSSIVMLIGFTMACRPIQPSLLLRSLIVTYHTPTSRVMSTAIEHLPLLLSDGTRQESRPRSRPQAMTAHGCHCEKMIGCNRCRFGGQLEASVSRVRVASLAAAGAVCSRTILKKLI